MREKLYPLGQSAKPCSHTIYHSENSPPLYSDLSENLPYSANCGNTRLVSSSTRSPNGLCLFNRTHDIFMHQNQKQKQIIHEYYKHNIQ